MCSVFVNIGLYISGCNIPSTLQQLTSFLYGNLRTTVHLICKYLFNKCSMYISILASIKIMLLEELKTDWKLKLIVTRSYLKKKCS